MTARALAISLAVALAPAIAIAVPRPSDPRLHPSQVSPLPTYVRRVEPAIVAVHVHAPEGAPSSQRLGADRFGSGVVFDARGYVLTVGYVVLDATKIEVLTRDDHAVRARVVAVDLDSGLGILKLDEPGPWPTALLGDSRDVAAGAVAGTVGVDEDNELVSVAARIDAIRRFAAPWEYMLERALILSPASSSWGGSAVVNERGEVVGIASLRLGQEPYVNLAIPIERFLAVKDEIMEVGRVVSRPPRPWLGLMTVQVTDGVAVEETSPVGPARMAGFRKGDRIIRVNGVPVASQEEFYEQLWRGRAGDTVELSVRRDGAERVIRVHSLDRATIYRTVDQ